MIFVTPESGRRPAMRRLFLANLIQPSCSISHVNLGQWHPKAILDLGHRRMILRDLQVSAFRRDDERAGGEQ